MLINEHCTVIISLRDRRQSLVTLALLRLLLSLSPPEPTLLSPATGSGNGSTPQWHGVINRQVLVSGSEALRQKFGYFWNRYQQRWKVARDNYVFWQTCSLLEYFHLVLLTCTSLRTEIYHILPHDINLTCSYSLLFPTIPNSLKTVLSFSHSHMKFQSLGIFIVKA